MNLTFFYDYRSPYSYLANSQMNDPHLAKLAPNIEFEPIDMLVLKRLANNQSSGVRKSKENYALADVARWAHRYGVALSPNMKLQQAMGRGECDSGLLSLAGLAAQELGVFEKVHKALFEAIWAGDDDLTSDPGRRHFLASRQIGAPDLWDLALHPETAKRLAKQNDKAIARGVFSAPTFFVENEMFFGNDRLEFVKQALRRLKESVHRITENHSDQDTYGCDKRPP